MSEGKKNGVKERIIGASTKLVSSKVILTLISLVQNIMMTRSLGVAAYGTLGVIQAFVGIVYSFLSVKIVDLFSQSLDEANSRDELIDSVRFNLLIEFSTRFTVLVIVWLLGHAYLTTIRYAGDLYCWMAIIAITNLLTFCDGVWFAVVRNRMNFNRLSIVPIVQDVSMLIGIVLGGCFSKMSIGYFVTIGCVVAACRLAVNLFDVSRNLGVPSFEILKFWKLKGRFRNFSKYFELIKYNFLSYSFLSFAKQADTILLSTFSSATTIGYYKLAKTITGVFQNTYDTLGSSYFQFFAEIYKAKEYGRLKKLVDKIVQYSAWVGVGLYLTYMLTGRFLVHFLFGAEYIGAIGILNIFLAGIFVCGVFYWVQPFLIVIGEGKQLYIQTIISQMLSLPIQIYLIYRFGASGAACATVVMWILLYGMLGRTVYKRFKLLLAPLGK